MTQPDELTRLREWNASLRENITHIAGQLVERTADLANAKRAAIACGAELIGDNVWRVPVNCAGDRKLWPRDTLAFLAGILLASLVAGVW